MGGKAAAMGGKKYERGPWIWGETCDKGGQKRTCAWTGKRPMMGWDLHRAKRGGNKERKGPGEDKMERGSDGATEKGGGGDQLVIGAWGKGNTPTKNRGNSDLKGENKQTRENTEDKGRGSMGRETLR